MNISKAEEEIPVARIASMSPFFANLRYNFLLNIGKNVLFVNSRSIGPYRYAESPFYRLVCGARTICSQFFITIDDRMHDRFAGLIDPWVVK